MAGYQPRRGHWGLDYSGYRPAASNLAAQGVRFVCRYLCYDNASTRWKIITPAEAAALGAAGIGVILNFEWYATRMVDPNVADKYQAGVADARQAVAQAQAMGSPKGITIVFSCDTGITSAQVPMMIQYMRGVESVCEAAGYDIDIYGGWLAVTAWSEDRIARGKTSRATWQAYAWSNVGPNRTIVITPYSDFFQHLGHPHFDPAQLGGPSATDENEVVSDSTGLVWVPGQPFTNPGGGEVPPPTPTQPTTGADMADFICNDGNDLLAIGPGGVMPITGEILDVYFNSDGSPKLPHKGELSGMPSLAERVRFFIENGVWPKPGGGAPSMALTTMVVGNAVRPLIPPPPVIPPFPSAVNLNPGQVVKLDPAQVVNTKIVDPANIVGAITASVVAALKASGIPATVDPAVIEASVAKSVKDVFSTAKVSETTSFSF